MAKRTPVRDVHLTLAIHPNIVRTGDDLLQVARQAIEHPETRVLAVLDDEGVLVGVLPVLRVVEEVVARAHPEALMAEIVDLESAGEFGRHIGALVAGDLMSPAASLRPESTVGDAFHAMHELHLSGLPVVDEERRVTGYIDLLELAVRYLDEYPPTVSREHAPHGGPLADAAIDPAPRDGDAGHGHEGRD